MASRNWVLLFSTKKSMTSCVIEFRGVDSFDLNSPSLEEKQKKWHSTFVDYLIALYLRLLHQLSSEKRHNFSIACQKSSKEEQGTRFVRTYLDFHAFQCIIDGLGGFLNAKTELFGISFESISTMVMHQSMFKSTHLIQAIGLERKALAVHGIRFL